MTDPNDQHDATREAFVRWVREQHDQMATYAVRRELIGDDAEGLPIWSVPHQVFLGRFYDKSAPEKGYWYISGGVPSDHIAVDLAADARQALRHFSLKWQLQAAQIEGGGKDGNTQPADFANVAGNLSRNAETLMAFADNDDLWRNIVDPTRPADAT